MQPRRNDYDVSNRVKTTDLIAVQKEINRLFRLLYPGVTHRAIDRAFSDMGEMYQGHDKDYFACDTSYHDIQHVLDVTLAMARLLDGYERAHHGTPAMGVKLFQLGVVVALFHDMGYLRKIDDGVATNGAEYTLTHVSRGSEFLAAYLPQIGLAEFAALGAELIHFTGFEQRVDDIKITDPLHRLLGSLLGSADIIAQMSDRCYLEKCRDRLYSEFVSGGIASKKTEHGDEQVVFASGDDLVKKTPVFFASAVNRLEQDLGGAYNFATSHFGGKNLYMQAATRNVDFARKFGENVSMTLRRTPPGSSDRLQEAG